MRRYLLDKDKVKNTVLGKSYDVMIVGFGLAGLYTALHIDKSLSVALIGKRSVEKSSSWYAQGGMAAVISSDDDIALHAEDTIKAGAGICDVRAVETLVADGPDIVKELVDYGVPFDVDVEGEILITREGGHRKRRIVHCGGDATGRETTKRLFEIASERENVEILEGASLIDVITDENGVTGLELIYDGKVYFHPTANVVLATGGVGQVYKYTTNPAGAVGDGIAAAYRAGAEIKNMELVQFHPTTLIPHGKAERLFLISEAVRGEGGILKNGKGDAFMADAHEMKDLAPRDIVTRAILAELEESGEENVFLDVSAMSVEFFKKRFPTIFAKCEEYGIELTKDMIPVRPGQHYIMGGIKTDLDGRTSKAGLYACGEAACTGIHGANRLASNSMLECLVFGRRAARCINQNTRKLCGREKLDISAHSDSENTITHERAAVLRAKIRTLMTKYAGPIRSRKGLLKLKASLSRIAKELETYRIDDIYEAELYNMCNVAQLIADGAINRKESVGAHCIHDESLCVNKQ